MLALVDPFALKYNLVSNTSPDNVKGVFFVPATGDGRPIDPKYARCSTVLRADHGPPGNQSKPLAERLWLPPDYYGKRQNAA
jgi:hypothetical protein